MTAGARYVRIVEWSDEDGCFVGSCPGLFYAGCHGDDEKAVFAELCELVEETIELTRRTASRCRRLRRVRTTRTRCCRSPLEGFLRHSQP
jgi:predicted RNase H-like HicB family nuclease